MYVMAVTVMPVRLVVAILLITLATCLACIGLHGLPVNQLDARPFTGWRLWIRKVPNWLQQQLFSPLSCRFFSRKCFKCRLGYFTNLA
jgi:hypothetical protein